MQFVFKGPIPTFLTTSEWMPFTDTSGKCFIAIGNADYEIQPDVYLMLEHLAGQDIDFANSALVIDGKKAYFWDFNGKKEST